MSPRTVRILAALLGCVVALRAWSQSPPTAAPVPATASGVAPQASAATPATPAVQAVPAASAPAVPAGAVRPVRAPLVWTLDIEAPKSVLPVLQSYLDIARFQTALKKNQAAQGAAGASAPVAKPFAPPPSAASASASAPAASSPADANGPVTRISRGELRRLVSAAPDQALGLLQTLGYFSPTIKTAVIDGSTTVVRITVDPGAQTRVVDVHIEFEGELDTRAEHGEADAVKLSEALRKGWTLPVRRVFTQEAWSGAKNTLLAQLRAQGYPTATWAGTSAHVDAAQRECRLFLVADSGPRFYFGPVTIEGLKRQDPQTVHNLLTFAPGEPYSEKKLLDTQEALQKAGLYDTVYVTMDRSPQDAAAAPVTIRLHELPLQQATFGVGVSADTGPRVSLEHVHRRVFNTDWQSKGLIQLGRDQRILQLDLTSHPLANGHRNLVSGATTHLVADGTETSSHRLRVGRTQDTERIERLFYLEYQQATVKQNAARIDASALFFNYQWVLRSLDSVLLPTRGFATQLEAGVGQSFATTQSNGLFTRLYGKGVFYEPLPAHWYASARAEAAQVFVHASTGVPDPLLFRAGGDDSVRGYGYRDLGPVQDGINVGGAVLATASLELAHPLSDRYPNWWGATFVDVGDAANSVRGWVPHWGYGVGLRWRSPVGPLRLDLAYGQSVHRVRLHFSVGITL